MSWIESHEELGDHHKTHTLAKHLNCSIPTAVGTVHLLWHYTLRVSWEYGDLSNHTPEAIARACWFDGLPDHLITALNASGFMDKMKVHDWHIYAKELIYQRLYNKKRKELNTCKTPVKKLLRQTKKSATIPNHTIPNHTIPNQQIEEVGKTSSPQQIFIEHFGKIYNLITGQNFKADKKHFILAAGLINKHGMEVLNQKASILCAMCQKGEVWFVKNGMADFTLENLIRHWNSIIPIEKMSDNEIKDIKFKDALKLERMKREQFKANVV